MFRRILSKAKKDEEERGRGRGKKKFAANGVSLMNAFFVPGKQRGPGPILCLEALRREINKFRTFAKKKKPSNSCTSLCVTSLSRNRTRASLIPLRATHRHKS